MQLIRPFFTSLALAISVGMLGPSPVLGQETIGINPPSDPTLVGGAVLSYHRQVSVPRLTIPGQFVITDTVKNIGSLAASNVVVRQELPAGWSANGQSTLKYTLGDIGAGEEVHRTTTIAVASSSLTGRFPNEATVSADGLESVQAMAMIDLTRQAVLGASVLPETGKNPAWPVALGGSLVGLGLLASLRGRRQT